MIVERFILVLFIVGCFAAGAWATVDKVVDQTSSALEEKKKAADRGNHYHVFYPNQQSSYQKPAKETSFLMEDFDSSEDLEFQDEESAGADGVATDGSSTTTTTQESPDNSGGDQGGVEEVQEGDGGGDDGGGGPQPGGGQQWQESGSMDSDKPPGPQVPCPPGIPGLKPGARCYKNAQTGGVCIPDEDFVDGGDGGGESGGGDDGGQGQEGGDGEGEVARRKTGAKVVSKRPGKVVSGGKTAKGRTSRGGRPVRLLPRTGSRSRGVKIVNPRKIAVPTKKSTFSQVRKSRGTRKVPVTKGLRGKGRGRL